MGRLLFLLSALSALGMIALQQNVGVLGRNVPQAGGGGGGGGGGGEPAALLSASDIGSPIGGFIPPDPTGDSIDFGLGIALRYRSGTPYLYSIGQLGNVVEYSIPTDGQLATALGGSPSWTTATATQQFGDIYQNAIWEDHSNGFSAPPYTGIPNITPTNLCWDDIDSRLYWNLLNDYDNTTTSAPTVIGYSTLNDSTHTGTGVGVWRLSQPIGSGGFNNRWGGACQVIPSVFAAQLGGRHLMVGPGGYHSIATNGPVSMGPAAFAVDTTGFTGPTNRDYFAGTILPLQNHPYSTASTPLRALRPGSIPTGLNNQGLDGVWQGTNTSWGWGDHSWGMVWINGPNKRGVVYIAQLFAGDAAMTVQASPAPTHTTFTVDALGVDVRVGYVIRLFTDTTVGGGHYNFDVAVITNINTGGVHPIITVNSMAFGDGSGADTTGIPISGTLANCGQGYQGAGNWESGWWDVSLIYDPDDMVKVANNVLSPDQITLKSSAQMVVPSFTFPLNGGFSGTAAAAQPLGAVYDSTAHRLYVFYHFGTLVAGHAQVVVYPVSD